MTHLSSGIRKNTQLFLKPHSGVTSSVPEEDGGQGQGPALAAVGGGRGACRLNLTQVGGAQRLCGGAQGSEVVCLFAVPPGSRQTQAPVEPTHRVRPRAPPHRAAPQSSY